MKSFTYTTVLPEECDEVSIRKISGAVGLAHKARGLVSGTELCVEEMRKDKGYLLLCAKDISDNTKDRLCYTAVSHGIPYTFSPLSKTDLSGILGKKSDTSAVLFTDNGFVKIIEKNFNIKFDKHTTDTEVLQ